MRVDTALVGRRAELAQLHRLLTEDAERAVLVSGPAGVGKTALIGQVGARAEAEGWQVVRILGVEVEAPFSLGGLHQLVCGLQEFRAVLDEGDRSALAAVSGADLEAPLSAMTLVVAVLNLLAMAAQTTPMLLVVDDVQWLDNVSATVLGAVGRRLASQRVRILAGLRVPSPSGFDRGGWTELALGPLDGEDSARLLACAAAPLGAAARAAILAAAHGNPLALVELPRCADQVEEWSGTVPLTERLVAVFGGRLGDLHPGVRTELLRAAYDGIAASGTANHGRYEMADVAQAVEAGLLIVDPCGRLVFRHPLVGAAVIHQASEQERHDAHRHLAGLYDDVLVRRATHLAAAATTGDQEVADLLARAARVSIRQGGLGVAAEWLRRAAELSTTTERRAALTADAVFVAAQAGRFDKARTISESIGADEEESAATVLANAYAAFHGRGEVISTHWPLIRALERADILDDQTVNQMVNLLLSITNYAGDYERWQQANDALQPLTARVDPAILLFRHRYSDIATTARAVRSVLSEYAPRLAAPGPREVMQLAFPAYCIDAMNDLRAPLRLAYKKFRQDGPSIDAMAMGCALMLDLMAIGHWEQAEQLGADGLAMAQQIQGGELLRHHFLANLGILAAWQGDLHTARRHAADVTAWSTPRGLGLFLGFAQRIAMMVALAEADYEVAYHVAVSICPPDGFPPFNSHVGEGLLDFVEAALRTGRLEEARTHAAVLARLRPADVSPRLEALSVAVSAMTGPDSEADSLYQCALSHPGLAEFGFERARIALAHGMWLRRQRRHTHARQALTRAAKEFDHLGAQPWTDRARAELRAAEAPGIRSAVQGAPLSAQERRIADLAATGATTKQIAAQFSLSPRTVDTHLRNLFPKLGITSRAALSEALRQRDSIDVQESGNRTTRTRTAVP